MIDIKGKYCKDVKIFTDNVEEEAITLIYNIANHPTFENKKIRIMPDVHAGKGITIGFTCPLSDYVSPAHVGCDIGCSMTSMIFDKKLEEKDFVEVEHKIRQVIPTGFDINKKREFEMKEFIKFMNTEMNKARSSWPEMVYAVNVDEKYITQLLKRIKMDSGVFYKSIGTVGGGNHFIEYGEFENGSAWTIHCGSRNFGMKIFKYWEKVAQNNSLSKSEIKDFTTTFKNDYMKNHSDMRNFQKALNEFLNSKKEGHYNGYLNGENMIGYITDLFFAQAYAKFNHKIISEKIYDIVRNFGLNKIEEKIYTTHNYISPYDQIIRKGAIASYEGEKMIIPFNMRDGLAICVGKSNREWNYSAPHGAGRIMSRSKAKQNVDIEEFKKAMDGIYSTSIGVGTLDEAPMVYKNCDEIISLIEPTCDILFLIKPKINIKAFESIEE